MTHDSTDGGGSAFGETEQRAAIRERYASIADESSDGCCGPAAPGRPSEAAYADRAAQLGYEPDQIASVDEGANLGLGCGNPTAIASLSAGDSVLDLGSGAGFDCFLAAQEVGAEGRVIGVDMTPEMVERARENGRRNGFTNVEFRLGEIEYLPVGDETVDVIVSNCVINLSMDKPRVFREAFRVLRPGGRVAISDVVLTAELPSELRADPASVVACVGNAASIPALETMMESAGFSSVSIDPKDGSESFIREWDDERDLSEYIVAAQIEGTKPSA